MGRLAELSVQCAVLIAPYGLKTGRATETTEFTEGNNQRRHGKHGKHGKHGRYSNVECRIPAEVDCPGSDREAHALALGGPASLTNEYPFSVLSVYSVALFVFVFLRLVLVVRHSRFAAVPAPQGWADSMSFRCNALCLLHPTG